MLKLSINVCHVMALLALTVNCWTRAINWTTGLIKIANTKDSDDTVPRLPNQYRRRESNTLPVSNMKMAPENFSQPN